MISAGSRKGLLLKAQVFIDKNKFDAILDAASSGDDDLIADAIRGIAVLTDACLCAGGVKG